MTKEVIEYAGNNKNAILFLQNATEDYLGARVSFLNGLIQPGYISAQQAIEKILKCYVLLLSPNENLRDKMKYPTHDLQSLLKGLSKLTGESYDTFNEYCFILSKVYYCLRYPEKKFINDFSINRLSTESIHELDELFLYLFVKLPMPDKNKCRLGLLSIMMIGNDQLLKQHFISNNIAYMKWINYFNKPFEWWQLSKEEQSAQPFVMIIGIEDVKCYTQI
jgi:HEPN domain-containing protein